MNDDAQPGGTTPNFDPEVQCDECGVFGAYGVGDNHLCADCYAGKGSCCREFGKDDLWRPEDLSTSDGK